MEKPPIIDLIEIQHLATERHGEFEVMRYMLELNDDISDADIDKMVDEVSAPIVKAIDCKKCGNCCRSLDVYLAEGDAKRLSDGIHIPLETIVTDYVDREGAAKFKEWGRFRAKPCAFLDGTLCSVYAHRPETCRTYPQFTPDFRWVLEDLLDGAHLCPIIYNVLDIMVDKIEHFYDGNLPAS